MENSDLLKSIRQLIETYTDKNFRFGFNSKSPGVKLHEPTYGADEIIAGLETLLSTNVTMGEKVLQFEKEFGDSLDRSSALMVNSGSSANLLAVAALANPAYPNGLREGDEVIVPALCWSTTVWPLIQHKLIPVVVDVDPKTFNMDIAELKKAISPKTRAIMPVHVYGNPCAMDEMMQVVNDNKLILIEDSCEALGTEYRGKPAGAFGRVGTFSFYFSHHMTTLEGGMCVTKDEKLLEIMTILRAHGWVRQIKNSASYISQNPEIDPRFLFVNQGYNFRATELQGAFGSIQLKKLAGFNEKRRNNAKFFLEAFKPFANYFDFQTSTPNSQHNWFGFSFVVKKSAPFQIHEMIAFLKTRNIESRPIICGNIAAQPAMKLYPHRVVGDMTHSNHIMKNAFSIGCHQDVDAQSRNWIVSAVTDFLKSKGLS